jgi:phage-related protein (TIGR01555 family)
MNTDVKQSPNIVKRTAQMIWDGWSNFVAGLGGAIDKNKQTKARLNGIMSDDELENIFLDDGLGTNIVKAIPDDMFREGWEYQFPDADELKTIELTDEYDAVLENINAVAKIREAFYWARLYGGAVIIIGALDGQTLDKPLVPKRIREGGIEYLRVVDRSDITFQNIVFQLDPMKPRYGLPEYYPIKSANPNGVQQVNLVHHSRVIEIHGEPIPEGADRFDKEQRYWGVSVIQNVIDYLKTVGGSIGDVGHLLHESSVGKYKLSDLTDILSQTDGEKLIRQRVEVMDMTKSVFHSIYLDKDDDFVREHVNFAGIPQVLHIFFMMVSSCTGIPITRLFGVSPAGMNATGESDMRNYYDKVRSKQTGEAAPVLLRLVRIIAQSQNLPEPYVIWKPLQQLSPKEQAEVDKLEADTEQVKAQTYQAYINAGIMEPYEARHLIFGKTLDDIPVPEEEEENKLPPVETLPDDPDAEEPPDDEDEPADDSDDDEPAPDPEKRIAELEEKEELTEEEQEELDKLKKEAEEKKKKENK